MGTPRIVPPTIPFELYRPIFEHITSSKDLCALSKASRAAQVEAERVFYSHLQAHDIKNVIAVCRRICNLARVGSYVRSIVMDYEGPNYYDLLHSFYALLAQALYRTPNLIRLQIRFNDVESFENAVSDCQISKFWSFRLRHLHVPIVSEIIFEKFLPNQQDIRFLPAEITYHDDNKLLIESPDFLPRLCCLQTSTYKTMAYFLSHRPITHLSLVLHRMSATYGLAVRR
jgi:hypothetical protein